MSLAHLIAQFARQTSCELADTDLRAIAVRYIVDTVAVTIAGYPEPALSMLESFLGGESSASQQGVRLPWSDRFYRPDDAALVTGMSSHILDYDDVSMLAVCHPSAPVVSALWPLASQVPVSGVEMVDAFLVGTEVLIRLGQAMGFRHYELGYHATATLGVVGAAVACARLLRLSESQTVNALAIAASQSGGLRNNFGTMTKSLHVGLAACNGYRAARMAQSGLTGSSDVFEGRGWLHAFTGGAISDRVDPEVVFGKPFVLDETGFEQKRYPCCYLTHKIITATLLLRSRHNLNLEQLRRALVRVGPGGTSALIHPFPQDGLSAKFSAPYAVVAALIDGYVDLTSFEDDAVQRKEIQLALHKVHVTEDSQMRAEHGSDVAEAPVTVELETSTGVVFRETVSALPGSRQDPMSDDDLYRKWADCLRKGLPHIDQKKYGQLFETGMNLTDYSRVADWFASLQISESTGK